MQNSKIKTRRTDKNQSSNLRVFDLEDRMEKFGVGIINFCRSLDADYVSRPIISQLVRSATSIGANYAEANNASSKRDFQNKVSLSKKESQETIHWLRMLDPCFLQHQTKINNFRNEAHEFVLILQSITNKLKLKVEV